MQNDIHNRLSRELSRFLTNEMLADLQDSLVLLRDFAQGGHPTMNDYAFIIFPAARAYEGFLKIFFEKLGVLNAEHTRDRLFRIGRSFNPDLFSDRRGDHWIYDDVSKIVGEGVARSMWQTWLDARNHLFHYAPDDKYEISYKEADQLFSRVLETMEEALAAAN